MNRAVAWVALPILLIVIGAAAFLAGDPLRSFRGGVPPVEELTVERSIINDDGIRLLVRAGGSEPMRIAQVQVDGAYWAFVQEPPGPLGRLEAAWIIIPYPWVQGETHHIGLVTNTGLIFEHTIDVAVSAPRRTVAMVWRQGFVGFLIGVVPVALGMLFYPALRAGGAWAFTFALALTVGLLAFLLVDTLAEALEFAVEAAPQFEGPVIVWLVALLTFALLFAVGRRKGRALTGVPLATSIALGIGLHNFGEGLAVGSAFATGAVALGTFLVFGFMLHNVTEGIGIVAPVVEERPSWLVFVGLAALAGLPAVVGVWIGSYAFSSHWAALALAVGAGAILQVIVEVTLFLVRRSRASGQSWLSTPSLSGIAAGVAVMYATALLVQV